MDIARPRSKTPRRALWIGGLALAGLLVVGTFARAALRPAEPKVDAQGLWTERVQRGPLLRQVPAQGALVPERVQWLSAVSAARVAKIPVRAGAKVEADTVVVVLENSDLELAALEAERQAASAETSLIQLDVATHAGNLAQEAALLSLKLDATSAGLKNDSAERLAKEQLVSELDRRDASERSQALQKKLAVEEGHLGVLQRGREAQITAQRAELGRLKDIAAFRRRQLAALEIKAGVAGVVQEIPLESGQWVAIGTLLAKVAPPDHLKAELKIAEAQAGDVHKGQEASLTIAGAPVRGRVDRMDPAVVGGSVRLDVVFDAPLPAGARSDLSVIGYVEIEKVEGVLRVTRPAGTRENGPAAVYRVEQDKEHATRVEVKLGRGSAREVEIVEGLAEGDEIVVSDVSAWDGKSRVRLR